MKYEIQPTATPKALVVHCGDPRFQDPIHMFLLSELGLRMGDYVPLVVGGGVASLTVAELPKEVKYMTDAINFYVGHFGSIGRVVLINHEDCGKYKALQRTMPHLTDLVKNIAGRQRVDLQKVSDAIALFAPRHVDVERYFAKFDNPEHTTVIFEKN